MKKFGWKSFGFALLQQLAAAGIFLAIAGMLINSYIKVDSIDGSRVYKILPAENNVEFEESEVYQDLFRNTVSDIIQFVAIRERLETDGLFDLSKNIDVSELVSELGINKAKTVSSEYQLDDLIKWGKYGIGYESRMMSLSDFINYFGYCVYPENFKLDEYGQVCFDDFNHVGDIVIREKSPEEIKRIEEELENSGYGKAQLEDLIFAYIMTQNLDDLEVVQENGKMKVMVSFMTERYTNSSGKNISESVNNWIDYMRLQSNLAEAVNALTLDYQRYIICTNAYAENKSNVKYFVRLMSEDKLSTYTNIQELKTASDENVTEVFSEYRGYLIYYPDSLVFMGNAFLSDSEIYEMVENNYYKNPDSIHIWLGVDGTYSVRGDAFYEAERLYNRIVPGVDRIITVIVALLLCWIGIGIYFTLTVGRAVTFEGKSSKGYPVRIWTEVLLVLAGAFGYGCYRGFLLLMKIMESVDRGFVQGTNLLMSDSMQYLAFAVYGIYLSLTISLIWYSIVRRFMAKTLWKGSLLYRGFTLIKKVLGFLLNHRNTVVSVLVPYNLFLFVNIAGVVVIFRQWSVSVAVSVVIMIILIIFDSVIGVLVFRSNAERNEILKSIERIHDGEVEHKIDTGIFHGANKVLADGVNNIGDGIQKAVRTSMKDEQMKTDLITNVSHDIKTPLTSIISYVDLLKRLKIKEEPAKSYIDILDGKAQRLKQLTDDLVEVSKISSGNIILNKEKLNLTELLNQGIGEFSDKFRESGLEVIFERGDKPGYIYADSRRMWRVVENLLNNVCKYALRDTRVYVDVTAENDRIDVSIKNISRQQMNISPEELTERFIRGDSARSTEGSGLGLSIAQSLTRVQGGEFEIYLDGDLFKVTLSFPECKKVEIE